MHELRFVGLSDDGSTMILRASDGQQYSVPIDQRLSVAVRRDRSRLGQLEIEMDGGLRPKDIQARIRAGMSAEEVAAASGLPLDKVQRFEGAVLSERAYIAQKAQGTTVRTPGGSGMLAEVVAERLASRGVDPSTMRWDSWRRDDGRWVVFLGYGAAGGDEQSATWVYDTIARAVVPADDDARWLVEDRPAVVPEPEHTGPRLVPVPDAVDDDLDLDLPFDQEAFDEPEVQVDPVVAPVVRERAPAAERPRPEPKPAGGSRSKRPAVPSWDEILFGTKKSD